MQQSDSEIFFAFTKKIPDNYFEKPILISGKESENEAGQEFILLKQDDKIQKVFEIRYTTSCGPYKESVIFNNIIIACHHEFLYMYDMVQDINIRRIKLQGYFGHLYINKDKLYVTDATGVFCFNGIGRMLWHNGELGIDGVFISDFDNNKISGSGEWDPPGGWKDFTLDIETGRSLTSKHNQL